MDEFGESQTTPKSTNRNDLQVAAGSLETLAWSIRMADQGDQHTR